LYELRDLSAYPFDEEDDNDGSDLEEDVSDGRLHSSQKELIWSSLDELEQQHANLSFFWHSMGGDRSEMIGIMFLNVLSIGEAAAVKTLAHLLSDENGREAFKVVTPQHLAALHNMLRRIALDSSGAPPVREDEPLAAIQFCDVRVASIYQLVFDEVRRWMKASSRRQPFSTDHRTIQVCNAATSSSSRLICRGVIQIPPPKRIFNGLYFYQELAKLRPRPPSAIPPNDFASKMPHEQVRAQSPPTNRPPAKVQDRLPADEYREIILEKVRRDRVVVIHGETGCGKSSRIPVSHCTQTHTH
jgi:ABC-type multidrug transport system fused ATPase/permease subunit